MGTVSVIIPNLNSPIIDQVVSCVLQQTHRPDEIIVVGCDTLNRLQRLPHAVLRSVQVVDTETPIGPAAARNRGASLASGDTLSFLDSDCLMAPDCLARLIARHEEGWPVVGGGIRFPNNRENYWSQCDNLLSFSDNIHLAPAGKRPYLPSLNFSIVRDRFLAIGGFDERFKLPSGEDVDLSMRLREQGCDLFFEPQAVVLHCHFRTSPGSVWHHLHMFGRTYVRLCRRYPALQPRQYDPDRLRPFWVGVLLAAPLLAFVDAMHLYRTTPGLGRFIHLLPGLVWGKVAWYWGAAESIAIGYGKWYT